MHIEVSSIGFLHASLLRTKFSDTIWRKENKALSKAYKWLFVENIPLLYEAVRVAKQFQIELWLDSSLLLQAFDLKLVNSEKQGKMSYIA